VEDVGHYLIGGHEVVGVEGFNDTLLGLTERAGAGDATEHEEAKVVGVDGRGINQLTCLIVVIERVRHAVDIVTMGLTKALPKHEVVQQGVRASEGPAV
jgi:hypothetical protein